jgi:two-component system nitrate/nitrite sensor histidine kinase NarX
MGQVLGYLKMQARAARLLLARGQTAEVDSYLAQMLAAAQDTHADVREYILGSGARPSGDSAFLPALERYVLRFGETCGISPSLEVQAGLRDEAFDPMVAAQLLRIIQEALTNVRKHAGASQVRVELGASDGRAEIIVQDNGNGFQLSSGEEGDRTTFGLRFMRERAEDVGGSVHVQSAPGGGTRVLVSVPLRKGQS